MLFTKVALVADEAYLTPISSHIDLSWALVLSNNSSSVYIIGSSSTGFSSSTISERSEYPVLLGSNFD